MPGIFISYRRSDNPDATGRIYDRLVQEFGKERVFKDVDSIPLGQDFRGHLNGIVGDCAAVLAIIGPRWIDFRNDAGQRRLDDPDDFVRIELEAALTRDIPVVPVLVAHASLPGTSVLPSSLTSLAYRQSIEVRPDPDFHNDATRLVAALKKILDPNAPDDVRKVESPALTIAPAGMRKGTPWLVAALAAASVLAAALALPALKHLRESPPTEIRTEISTPESDRPQDIALSPDGRQIVFAGRDGDATRLWLRSLDSDVERPLPGTEGAMDPFWSPGSGSIAFFTANALKRIDLAGGLVREIVPRNGPPGAGGGSWSAQGVILYSQIPGPIMRVRDTGGEAVAVTKIGEELILHVGPQFVGDGHRFLYTEVVTGGEKGGIYLGSLEGGTAIKLVDATSRGTWMPSGWMLWEQDGSLLAQRLDLETSALTGDPVAIADKVARFAGTRGSVSNTGLIAFRRANRILTQLQWVDRSGAELGTVGEPDPTNQLPRISPDGRRIALVRSVGENMDIWTYEGPRLSRVTFGAAADSTPLWSTDGRSLLFSSLSAEGFGMYQKPVGTGAEVRLDQAESIEMSSPTSLSPDGRYLLYSSISKTKLDPDLFLRSMEKDGKAWPWLQTPFRENFATFSPDGKWVAYASDASNTWEVYVRPFHPPTGATTDEPDTQWQVSVAGGSVPTWRRDGKEIYFLNSSGDLMASPVTVSGSTPLFGTPVRLFATRVYARGNLDSMDREYDVAPDGRFLINNLLDTGGSSAITLIQNWNPEAKSQNR